MGIHEQLCKIIYVLFTSHQKQGSDSLIIIEKPTQGLCIKGFSLVFPQIPAVASSTPYLAS
jgi:hypothetical protein